MISVFYLLIEAVSSGGESGAFVYCWIEADLTSDAERIACKRIEEEGWRIACIEKAIQVDPSYYEDDSEGLQYFNQALIDKEVLIFNIFPTKEQTDKT